MTLTVSVAANAPASVTNSATVSGGGASNTPTANDPTTINAAGQPTLTISKSHSGNFTQGGTGTYSITAGNSGTVATSGAVTMTDTIPSGLTATALTGTGWTCALTPTVNCTRSDALAGGASYPAMTLTVSVASNAPASVTNTATVSGGGAGNTPTANDPTTINAAGQPTLTISKSHSGNFTQSGTGSYSITVGNSGTASTSGAVSMTDTVPTGLTATALSGTGWTCALTPTVNCTRSDALAGGASYPAMTLTVSVAANAPASVTNSATVSGGGASNTPTANDPTTITATAGPISDDFHALILNTNLWTFVNPVGDATLGFNGTELAINVPAGNSHDVWVGAENGARVLQQVTNGDFEVEAKFDTPVTTQYQEQGIIVEQDSTTFLRYDIYFDGSTPRLFSVSFSGSVATVNLSTAVSSVGAPVWLRLQRAGNTWTAKWSTDGNTFTTAATFTTAMNVARVGPWAGNCCAPSSPAFTAWVDHFFNAASPITPEDGGPPVISAVSANPGMNGAIITWTTNRATTSQVSYGTTTAYGTTIPINTTMVTSHSVSLSSLICNTQYHYKVTSGNLGGADTGNSPDATFTTSACATLGPPVSDNFDSTTLNSNLWTFVNSLGDASVTLNGTNAILNLPGGPSHDAWTGSNTTVRLMQNIANVDFDVEVKFQTQGAAEYQDQGIMVEQDSSNYIRFDLFEADCQAAVFVATFSGGNPTVQLNSRVRNGPNNYFRLKRTGNTWTFSYSYDNLRWTTAITFTYALTVNRIGPYAGNGGANGGPSPAFVSSIDYFANRAAPPATNDGHPFGYTSAPPVINVWYGNNQTFGQNGVPQQWVNILGNITDSDGIASLTYALNGGAAQNLWIGENAFRLVDPGDFNVEIDYASLNPGSNTVVITAVDKVGLQSSQTVTVNYVSGKTWPKNYSINWATAGNIQNVAQITDGQWAIQSDGTVRTMQTGYDRLLTIGDRNTWTDYEVLLQFTVHSFDCHDFAVGVVTGWQGHTTLQYGVPLPDQPRTGHPFPGFGTFATVTSSLHANLIYCNTPSRPETILIQDTSGFQVQVGSPYFMRFRTQRNTSGGSHYSLKVWASGTTEPTAWTIETDGELNTGSILLGAHRTDVSFGPVTITGL
jgi:uncharacterized repeat protein (TIGR01451 family)